MLVIVPFATSAQLPTGPNPYPVEAADFVLRTFDRYPAVGIGDIPGCEQLHFFLRSLIRNPAFAAKVNYIVVDFGNPRFQSILDRYILTGEMVPRQVLRHVWDDTTRAVELTWNSPVYEEFFDAVRAANLSLAKEKKIHVLVADSPIDWEQSRPKTRSVHSLALCGAAHSQTR